MTLSRRSFLKSAGTMVALPALEAMLPKRALAAAAAPKRLLFYYVPCGIRMSSWTPAATGANWQLTPILEPLATVKSDVTILTGLANAPSRPDGPGDHAAGPAILEEDYFTCRVLDGWSFVISDAGDILLNRKA